MGKAAGRLEQALIDLIDAYTDVEGSAEESFSNDEDSYAHAVIESLETSLDSAIDDADITTTQFAALLANLSEALEQLDPSAFEDDLLEEDEDSDMESIEELDDYDDDDDDYDDYDD